MTKSHKQKISISMQRKVAFATFLFIFLVNFTSAVSIRNNNVSYGVNINNPSTSAIISGSNVSSVTSSDGCIIVNPTRGDVVLTFNSSCAGSTTISVLSPYLNRSVVGSSVTIQFNESQLNSTILLEGLRNGFNSTFNSTYNQWAYNQTTAVFLMSLLNNTIADYGVRIGFNSTFNSTYAPWSYNQTYDNMSLGTNRSNCWFDDCSGYRNPFNQVVNTTSNVTVKTINVDTTALEGVALFKFFGTQVGRITFENAVFQIMGVPGVFPTWLGDCGSACLIAGIDGIFQMSATKSNQVRNNNVLDLEINNTMTTVYTNLTVNYNLTLFGETYSKQNITVIGNITAKVDLCNGDGKCLNQTIKDPNTFRNGTLLYWNNNTRLWTAIPDAPANSEIPLWCTGTGGGWTFVDRASGVCPL